MSRLRNPLLAGVLISLALAILFGAHRYGRGIPAIGDFLETLERGTLDLRFRLRGELEPGGETALVVFDDKTFEARPELFERRAGWEKILRAVSAHKPKVIAVDAFFSKPERLLSVDLQKDIGAYLGSKPELSSQFHSFAVVATELLRRVQEQARGDERLAKAIEEIGNVVLAMHLGSGGGDQTQTEPDESLRKGRYGQSVPGKYQPFEADEVLASLPMFCEAARALGTVTVFEDLTRTVRQLPMVFAHDQGLYAPLAVQAVALYRGLGRGQIAYLGHDHSVRIGKQVIELNGDDGRFLNFRGPAGTFETISMIDLLEDEVKPGTLTDRIVLLGITQLGHDSARTPFMSVFPAVELQATAIDNILAGDFITRSAPWLDMLICLAIGLLVSLLYWQRMSLPAWARVAGSLAVLAAYLGLSACLFSAGGLWTIWVGPVATCLTLMVVCLALSYLGEGMQRRRLRRAFAHYLSDEVIGELLADPRALSLGGERKELSVLFSDIRGFTNLSENIAPEELTALLNSYFGPMTRAVLAKGGLLDKYIGDALMAIFGAPLPEPDHARRALASVLQMHAELEKLRADAGPDRPTIDIGVGVNTGEMVVGNMGSEQRFDYTVVGDAVNLASRLEGLTRKYGVFCLVGERTQKEAGEDFSFRLVDRVQVKGKSLAVAVYELLSGPGRVIAGYDQVERFADGLRAFQKGDFGRAREQFDAFAAANPDDQVSRLYLERLAALGDEPPEGWDGVAVHETK